MNWRLGCWNPRELTKKWIPSRRNPREFQLSRYPFPWVPILVILILGPIFYMKGKARQTIEDISAEWKEEVEMWVGELLLLSPLKETLTRSAIPAEFPRNIFLKVF